MLRWNQILREVVARADLPPAPNGDGSTAGARSEHNPFAEPNFPFANPPYAARAYSYVALAQYEALKVAWYYKYLYKRPAPAKVDSGIRALAPVTDLPAYPSEDAVLSGVTTELLKLLFPTAVEEITLKAGEQRRLQRCCSGKATPSDIAAGLALGQAVAQVFAARAANDGMRGAAGWAPQWQALEDAAIARGEVPWKSLETPSRPPMLSFFGKVQTWLMTAADLAAERPGPPPSTSSAQMAAELAEARAARALALLNMAMHDAAVGCWDTKFAYFNPRPSQLDPRIRTLVGLPNFPSYESGHSAFSAAAAAVLSHVFPDASADFAAQRDEAALSRLYGGIHYRSDIEVGKQHGEAYRGVHIALRAAQ